MMAVTDCAKDWLPCMMTEGISQLSSGRQAPRAHLRHSTTLFNKHLVWYGMVWYEPVG